MGAVTSEYLYNIQGVSAGQTAIVKLPIGLTYHGITIPYSGVTLAQLKEIRVVANGDVIRRYVGGDRLDSINQFDQLTAAGGLLRLSFERQRMLTRQSQEMTILGTGWNATAAGRKQPESLPISSLQVEIDIDAAAAAPAIPYVIVERSAPQPSGDILRVIRKPYAPSGSGDYVISDMPIYGGLINRVHFVSANVSAVELKLDNQVRFKRTATENTRIQTDAKRRTPQAGIFTVDFTEKGYGGDFLDARAFQDISWTLTMSAGGQVDVEIETIDRLRKV